MLKDIVIQVSPRDQRGKNASRRMRATGQIPGIVYGGDRPVVPIAVDASQIVGILRSDSGENTLFTLHLGGTDTKRVVMIRDFQRDPVRGRLLHVDFVRVDLTKEIEVQVPLHLVGTAVGVKTEGGLLDHVARELTVSCLPADIPAALEVDVTNLHLGQHLSVRDIVPAARVRILADPDQTVAVVTVPRGEVSAHAEETAEGAAATPAEPEVIKKGKEAAPAAEGADAKKGGEPKKAGEAKKGKEGGKG